LTFETNAIAERVIGTLRRECLDHLIPLNEQHLRTILAVYADNYNRDRPHRTLHLQTPLPRASPRTGPIPLVSSRRVLGGLHHVYECAA
jgi:putative transposase